MNTIYQKQWPKRNPNFPFLPTHRSPLSPLLLISSLLVISSLLFLFVSFQTTPKTLPFRGPCGSSTEERFLWYAPHSGFSNQLSEFRNGLMFAGILNRTLVVPPVLDHHAVVLGSCPKFRVAEPRDIRKSVWDHSLELVKSGRYVSMMDIVDISSLVPSSIQVIDFRDFVSLWCHLNADLACKKSVNGESSLFESMWIFSIHMMYAQVQHECSTVQHDAARRSVFVLLRKICRLWIHNGSHTPNPF